MPQKRLPQGLQLVARLTRQCEMPHEMATVGIYSDRGVCVLNTPPKGRRPDEQWCKVQFLQFLH